MLQFMAPRLSLLRCDAAPDAPDKWRIMWGGAPDVSRALLCFLRVQGHRAAYFDRDTRCWLVASALLPDLARYFLPEVAPARQVVRSMGHAAAA